MAGVAEMGKSHTINKENLFKNRGGNRGGTDRGGQYHVLLIYFPNLFFNVKTTRQ